MSDAIRLRDAQIKRLAGLPSVIGVVLNVSDTMLPAQKESALQLCADLADNVAGGLDDLLGGAS